MEHPPQRDATIIFRELYRLVCAARDAAAASSKETDDIRRVTWENEQDAKRIQLQAKLERDIANMRSELSMLKAYLSLHPNIPIPASLQDSPLYDTISTTAFIEQYTSPESDALTYSPMSPVSPALSHPSVHQPMFVEGSSSRPLTAQGQHPDTPLPSLGPSASSYPMPIPGLPDSLYIIRTNSPEQFGPPTPLSRGASLTPGPEVPNLKRPRYVIEDDSDHNSDSEEDAGASATDRPRKRKNGHDDRCLTIHVRSFSPSESHGAR